MSFFILYEFIFYITYLFQSHMQFVHINNWYILNHLISYINWHGLTAVLYNKVYRKIFLCWLENFLSFFSISGAYFKYNMRFSCNKMCISFRQMTWSIIKSLKPKLGTHSISFKRLVWQDLPFTNINVIPWGSNVCLPRLSEPPFNFLETN